MLSTRVIKYISVLIFCVILISCNKSEYTQLVESELSKNITKDSLFLGMKLGQTKEDFFNQCWKLNAQDLVSQGPNNEFVSYNLPLKKGDSLTKSIRMLFYGIFDDKKIMTGMKMQFSYNSWSLWNKSYQPKKLMPVVKDTLKKWFPGNDFIKVNIKKNQKELFVKVDGNRRIIIKPIDDKKELKVRIDDLRHVLE